LKHWNDVDKAHRPSFNKVTTELIS